ncbi:hypothetical protein KIW84_031104 [Lathyrus oleraceus]|uniref:MATH domain-containing protein n=1 Tax=Pisum sativum TaxID=3888 RepID=A0A9D5B0D8_PEA|nr:hypothetical protein KIW84_031104 [Pisum sativum]
MVHEQSSVDKFEKFTWKIENFSHLNMYEVYSEPFFLGGYPWMIYLYPKGDEGVEDFLSIYLAVVKTTNMSEGWSRDVKFKLFVFNQLNANRTITIESSNEFNAREDSWGFEFFITLDELHDPENGFVVKDSCMFGAEVYVCKKEVVSFGNGHSVLWAEFFVSLKTKKVRDMNDIACKNLQIIWEELERFSFDLTWLEPLVQSALGMKRYLEKLKEAEKLRDNLVALELEMQGLKAKMATARDLLEAQDLEEEIDLDAELGFVKP